MPAVKNILSRQQLLSQSLYNQGYLWSYAPTSPAAVLPDEELIMSSLVHLEFEDMHLLFEAYPYRQIKEVWLRRMVPYNDYYGTINLLLAALFFHIKHPKEYIQKHVA